ncbi:depupylase/deamidase Dop [Trueperella sp. LYQ141]|uniref:depupylase/deamidase Dop n=1 Tax=Trueperella sp. LYQ141 TaxID=3391058 RepID=UPI0039839F75
MSVHRIMGLETEFGICREDRESSSLTATPMPNSSTVIHARGHAENHKAPGREPSGMNNPIVWSIQLVQAYAQAGSASGRAGAIPWDYRSEDPLCDARGYRLDRASAHPSQLTDDPIASAPDTEGVICRMPRPTPAQQALIRPANAVLTNGARFYVDHAHPEYSAPEVASAREAVLWDRAGEVIARHAMKCAEEQGHHLVVYKNNTDSKGAAYGCHENYLMERHADFTDVIRYLTAFFVTRPILCGTGRVGLGQRSEYAGFQISQRADFVENDVGLETTFNRPIINTRDEPHAHARWRRLHVIGGDANQFDISNLLKVGTTSLVISLIESGEIPLEWDSILLNDPVRATWEISHDPQLRREVDMFDGRSQSAIAIQQIYLDAAREHVERHGMNDEETAQVLQIWQEVLDDLRTDMMRAARRVEWIAKYQVLESLRQRLGGSWDHDKLRACDLQWHDLRPERSIVARLEAAGQVERIVSTSEVDHAVRYAPSSTRAYLRGGLIRRFAKQVQCAGWDSVTVDDGTDLLRVAMADPAAYCADRLGCVLEEGALADILAAVREQR